MRVGVDEAVGVWVDVGLVVCVGINVNVVVAAGFCKFIIKPPGWHDWSKGNAIARKIIARANPFGDVWLFIPPGV